FTGAFGARILVFVAASGVIGVLPRRVVVEYADVGRSDISRHQCGSGVGFALGRKPACDDALHCNLLSRRDDSGPMPMLCAFRASFCTLSGTWESICALPSRCIATGRSNWLPWADPQTPGRTTSSPPCTRTTTPSCCPTLN